MDIKPKKSKMAPTENFKPPQADFEQNLDKIINPIAEDVYQENDVFVEHNLEYIYKNSMCFDEPLDLLTPENINKIESFFSIQRPEITDELYKLMKKIVDFNSIELKQFLFVFTILKNEKEVSELIFKYFASKLENIVKDSVYGFSEETKEKIKRNKRLLYNLLHSALNERIENLAIELLLLSQFASIEEDLIKKALDLDLFSFLISLLKNTKEYFKTKVQISISQKSSRYSQAQAFKNVFQNSLSLQNIKSKADENEQETEFWNENDKANDNIHKCLSKNQEKAAIKLMAFYFMKFSRNFVKYSVLDFAVLNKDFYFIKRYFDMFPATRYKIKDFECITLIIGLLDEKENFLHGIFLLSKVNLLGLNEVYIRLIIDKYQNFLKFKLMLITYALNPVLVCAVIIKNLRTFQDLYANLRIKIKAICDEYLSLAKQIVDKVNDDTIFKTMFLKIFYPSQVSLLKILYEDRNYFMPILQNDILFNIVTDLWYCEYYWTINFMNSSSALKNLIEHYGSKDLHINPLEERFYMNKMLENSAFEASKESQNDDPQDLESTPINYLLFHKNIKGEYVTCPINEISMKNPFFFYQNTKFSRDVRYTNHIFSYYFFEKSPLFKVTFEIIAFTLISFFIFLNLFSIFRIRRDFNKTYSEILHFHDGMVDLRDRLPRTDYFEKIVFNYSQQHGTTYLESLKFFVQPLAIQEVCAAVFPWYTKECYKFYKDVDDIIYYREVFWILQLYYYLVFFQSVLEIVFVYKVQKKIIISNKNWIDILMFILNVYIHAFFFEYLANASYMRKNNVLDKYNTLEQIISVFIFMIWIKFITYLKLIKQFGTIIKVIEVMMTNLLSFFVIFGIIILAFASICFQLFDQYNPAQYGTFWLTLRTLMLLLFGQVDFIQYKENNLLAGIMVNFYEVITFVLLLNLLIAILSNTFNSYNQKSNLQNASILYNDYLAKRPDKFYSSLVGICPPFNIYLIFAAPILLFKKSSKINRICVLIGFFMYSLLFLSIYIIANLAVVFPLCYLRLALTVPLNLCVKQRRVKIGLSIWLMWIFLGPFYMFWIFLRYDVLLFIRSMFYSCTMKDKLDEITKEEIMLIYQKAEEHLKNGEEHINYHDLVEEIKDGIEEINMNFRKTTIQTKSAQWNILENIKKKTAQIIGLKTLPNLTGFQDQVLLVEKIENKINVFVEIDKMEVFSFLRQFIGINRLINLEKLKYLVNQIKFCKKFHLVTLSKSKRNKLIKVIQVNQMLAVEKSVINMMAEQVRNSKIFDKVLKKFIC